MKHPTEEAPLPIVEISKHRRMVMSIETIAVGVVAVAVSVTAWLTVTSDLKSERAINVMQDKRLELIETRSDLQRDVLYELRADMKTNREQTALVIEMLKANRTIGRE